jgi:fructose-1,6-bisphosphatase/inositol monophosphatase family enzyme
MSQNNLDVTAEIKRIQTKIVEVCARHPLPVGIPSKSIQTKMEGAYAENVTALDIAISAELLEHTRAVLPQSYSEEDLPRTPRTDEYFWQIDPIDGTDELIHGLTQYCGVSATLLQRTEKENYDPVGGILYLPIADTMVIGNKSDASVTILMSGKNVPIPAYDATSVRGPVRTMDPNERLPDYYEALGKSLKLPAYSIEGGAAVYSFVSLIMGELNVVCLNYDYAKEWDTSAAQVILELLGGFLCDLDGAPITYNRTDHFNRRGHIASICFSKEQLIPAITKELFISRL